MSNSYPVAELGDTGICRALSIQLDFALAHPLIRSIKMARFRVRALTVLHHAY